MLSRTAIHAVRALSHLAGLPAGTFAGSAVLAERIGAPANYLGKLLQGLAARGLVALGIGRRRARFYAIHLHRRTHVPVGGSVVVCP